MRVPVALSIAGSDPSGGAGIQADIKTFTALGVYGMSVITSITVQNTEGVFRTFDLPPELVYEQIETVAKDIKTDAVKTGMLGNEDILLVVAKALKDLSLGNLVVDPVLRSTTGEELTKGDVEVLKRELFPLAALITPNIPEAQVLCGLEVKRLRDVEACAKELHRTGARAVLIKGGHLEGEKVIDVLFTGGDEFHYFVGDRIRTKNTHGTGCTLSAAITAFLAKGRSIEEAVQKAKEYTQKAIEKNLNLGKGRGPLNHMWNLKVCTEPF